MTDLQTAKKVSATAKVLRKVLQALPVYCFIAGGAIVDILDNREPNDFDVFFRCADDFDACVGLLGKPDNVTENAFHYNLNGVEIDLIRQFYKPQELVDKIDFSCCRVAVDRHGQVFYGEDFFWSMRTRKVHINVQHPLICLTRIMKYTKKGFYFHYSYLVKCVKLSSEKHIKEAESFYWPDDVKIEI